MSRTSTRFASNSGKDPKDDYPAVGIACLVFLAVLFFWVYGARPLVAEPWQWADDGLYLRQSEGVVRWLHGDAKEWLGPYDPLIVSKAPLFAVLMAFLHVLRFPLRLAEFALLLMLPWLFRAAVRPVMTLSWWQVALTGTVLVALPFLPQEQRLLRSAFQASLVSGCLIGAVGVILRARGQQGLARWAALTGLFFSLGYLNREEALFLWPVIGCAFGAIVVGSWWSGAWRPGVVACLQLTVQIVAPIALVSGLNYQSYGVFVTTTRRAPEFTRAHQTLTSLEPRSREHYVPIKAVTRVKAYRVSPSFARMRPYLEGPESDIIARNPSHLYLSGRTPAMREFFVVNFQFVLQEAAFRAGARTAPESEALFAAITQELKDGIARGEIQAGGSGPATLAAPIRGDYRRIAAQTVLSLSKLYAMDSMVLLADGSSSGTPADLQRMESLAQTASTAPIDLKAVALPEVGVDVRRAVYDVITKCEMAVYGLGTLIVLGFIISTVGGGGDADRVALAFAGLVLGGALLAYSMAMAVADVLGFPLLKWSVAYNTLGYVPLSVLTALGMIIVFSRIRSPRPIGHAVRVENEISA